MQKITLTSSTRECIALDTFLGYEGENEANKLVFSFSDGFVDGVGVLNLKRGEQIGYVSLDKVGETYEFPVKNSILTQVGDIKFQVVITGYDGSVIKYDPFVMTVKDAIDADSEMPEDYPTWVDMANAKLAEVDEAIENVEAVASQLLDDKENGVFNGKDGKDGIDGKNGVNGVNGIDGISPIAKIVQTENGAIITVVDADGTTTAQLTNGKDGINGKDGTNGRDGVNGNDGANGTDGVSPTISTQQTDTGATITITDVNGTKTINLFNGADGKDGKDGTMSFEDLTEEQKATLKGEKGDNGADGFSPSANVTETETGATITITDNKGTTTATIKNGKDGTNGIDGKNGIDGTNGTDGADGTNGVTFTPSIDSNGNLSWTNDGGLENPATVNIKGEKGDTGANGADGTNGTNGTDGVDGADGYSPTAIVKTNTDTEYVLTITYKDSDGNIQTFDTPNLKGQGGGITDLPIATESTLGGVKVGNGLSITTEGVLSSTGSTNDMVVLTQEAYDALTEKDENTFYFISDGATGIDVLNKVTLTQSEYEALTTKSDTTLYFIKEVS